MSHGKHEVAIAVAQPMGTGEVVVQAQASQYQRLPEAAYGYGPPPGQQHAYHQQAMANNGAMFAAMNQKHGPSWVVRFPGSASQACLCGESGWTFGVCWPDACCNGGCCGNTGCNGCVCRNFYATPCMYGRAVSMANGSNCCCCCLCMTLCFCCERARMKTSYGIQGGCGCCQDLCCCWFCLPCGICQIIQEANYREDVRIGCCGHPDGSCKIACDCLTGELAKNQFRERITVTTVDMQR